jgi:transposase-like protein
MKIMHTMASEAIAGRPKRRFYSPELKTQVVAQCQTDGTSVAGVALAHGINANIVHRWLREHARDGLSVASQGFVPLTLEAGAVEPFRATAMPAEIKRDIRIEVHRGTGSVSVNWPLEGAESCAAWLRDWLR